ncbi:hypothetical protein QYE76_012203 [Lolium multiflorum]|uniref:Transposase (putative) gypsy type domain-containing protein n=1 Tax=Lolium multiflorum TaxID=4521 RepID=A0AAD8X3Q7_LOLMU|nr:hypothetical protein QYE76_012203 [Lolium multiflorum]
MIKLAGEDDVKEMVKLGAEDDVKEIVNVGEDDVKELVNLGEDVVALDQPRSLGEIPEIHLPRLHWSYLGLGSTRPRERNPHLARDIEYADKRGERFTQVSRDWSASAISNRDINKLRSLGFVSASEDDIRLPGAVSRPKPPKGFTVMFSAFLFRGLSLPAHEFLRSLLYFYGIQLWQTPNSILHLSVFVTVCEAFLGIDPHWGLWRKIFYVKRHNDSNGPPVVGGVGFVVGKEVDYLDYPMKESSGLAQQMVLSTRSFDVWAMLKPSSL